MSLPYRETPHAPLLHRLATKRNDGGSVPVLAHNACRFTDSTDILVYADKICGGNRLYPGDAASRHQVEQLEERFDSKLGPHTRRWAYQRLLSNTDLMMFLWSHQVPPVEASVLRLISPLVRQLVRVTYRINPESAQRSLDRIHEVFREVEQRLSDGRNYLTGGRFTAADLTFAALAAPALFPVECRAVLPALDEVPDSMRNEVLQLRDTVAGQFALRLYSQERGATWTNSCK